jgi:hypothetical protein
MLVSATPASANTSEGYIAGASTITDDFGDEGLLSSGNHRYSGATGLWQFILVADGAIESDGTTFDIADVDCDFGPNTTAATKNWQRRNGLTADGVVGPNTFSVADNKLRLTAWTGDLPSNVAYVGSRYTVRLIREENSGYWPKAYFMPGLNPRLTSIGIVGSNWDLADYTTATYQC